MDMLYYSAEHVPERFPVNPNEVLQNVLDLLRDMAAEQGVELRIELDQAMTGFPMDRAAIYRAIQNLVSNAVDACVESESGDTVILKSSLEGSDFAGRRESVGDAILCQKLF